MSSLCARLRKSSPTARTSLSPWLASGSSAGRRTRRWKRWRATAAISPPKGSDAALDALLDEIADADEETRGELRRAIVGILSEGDQGDPSAREYRRRLAAALY
jgi:hypothetical protein